MNSETLELIAAAKEMSALMDNLWKAVPWGKTFDLDIGLLNTAPERLKRAVRALENDSTGETSRQGPEGSTPSLPATDHARWLRLMDRALCGCFSLDCRVHGAYDCNDHKWVEAHRQKQEKPEWRPRHMDEGDDYVNEPRTGPVSDGPPGQEQKHEKGAGV